MWSCLFPLAVIIGGITFLIADQGVPRVTPKLIDWGIGEYSRKKAGAGSGKAIWMRAGNDILRASHANADATELTDIIIFRRGPDGKLLEQINAHTATLVNRRWQLEDVIIYHAGKRQTQPHQTIGVLGKHAPCPRRQAFR